MTQRIAGHALVEALVAQGVDTVFGVPGESFLAVLDGFHQHAQRIRFIACRQEGGAAFMADAQGKLSGRPGICFVTRGPGASNAAIGVHTALQDSTPMILFIGQVASDQRDREAFQEVDYRQMFGPGTLGMAKWAAQIDSADRVPEYVARAFHTAMQGRPGPVVLALPEDMLTTHTAAPVVPRVHVASAWPAPGALREVRSMLLAAKRPLVIAGGSGWDAEACLALQRFAENWQLPVGCAFRFQDTFDNRHPQYAGDVGIGINPKLGARVREADLIIALGIRLGEMTTGGYTLLQVPRPAQKLVHVHAGAEELGRVYQADLLLQSSMQHAAKALETLTAPAELPWREWTARCAARLRRQPRADPGVAARSGAGDEDRAAPGAGRHGLHQRRRQLRRLAAPLRAVPRAAAPWAHAAGADLRRDGLRRAGRDRGVAAVSAAHGGQRGRRRRLPDDGAGTRHGHRLRSGPRPRQADLDRGRQRQLRHDSHAPGARLPGARQRHRAVQSRLRAPGRGLWLARGARRSHRAVRGRVRAGARCARGRPCCT